MNFKNICLASLVTLMLSAPSSLAAGQEVQMFKLVDNGPDGKRKVVLVLGEGYSAMDKAKYYADVESNVINGALAHDVFQENKKGFNVYRLDIWSKDSGVSHTGKQKKTFFNVSIKDKTFADMASMMTGGGNSGGYFDLAKDFFDVLVRAEAVIGHADVVILLLNDPSDAGATYGKHWIVAGRGYDWRVMCHELGHALGNLYDEYSYPNRPYKDEPRNFLNSSTIKDRVTISWAGYLPIGIKVPTPLDRKASTNGVGIFEGGATYDKGIYHPGFECRMNNHETSSFCKSCAGLFATLLNQWLPTPKPLPYQNEIPKNFDINSLRGYTNFGIQIHKTDKIYDYGLGKLSTQKGTFVQNCYYPIGKYVVESYQKDNKVRTAQFLSDPFSVHMGFTKNKKSTEWSGDSDKGWAFFNLPYDSKEDAIKKGLGVRIYKMLPRDLSEKSAVERSSFVGPGPSLFSVVPPKVVPVPVKTGTSMPVKTGKESVPVKVVLSGSNPEFLSYPMAMYPAKLDEMKALKRLELLVDIKPEKLSSMIQSFKSKPLAPSHE